MLPVHMSYYNEVNDWLLTGGDLSLAEDLTGKQPEETARSLIEQGVSWVLDVRSEWTDADVWKKVDPSVRYCHAPIIDRWGHRPNESWYLAVEDFVGRFLNADEPGAKLYTHCHMGINRGTSAAMLALLTENPALDPYDAFLAIREVRPIAGLVYAGEVGRRHLVKQGDLEAAKAFPKRLEDYWQWNPELSAAVNRGIAYYRSKEGGTLVVPRSV
jgi:dual specificity phosphatase 3